MQGDDEKPEPDSPPRVSSDTWVVVSPLHPHRIAFVSSVADPPRNEAGALEACANLIEHLNRNGADWDPPIRAEGPEGGVDCTSRSASGTMYMQVTRAAHDTEFWRTLGVYKSARAYTTREDLTHDLWETISYKAERTPVAQRAGITLVLDAAHLFAHQTQDTVQLFRATYADKASLLGFHSIWIVGGHRTFVSRLS
jgi:hypothetical protein